MIHHHARVCTPCAPWQVVRLNSSVRNHIDMLRRVRWETTELLSAIEVAKGEAPDFLPVGGAFDNPRVRSERLREEFDKELRWADYVLQRFIESFDEVT